MQNITSLVKKYAAECSANKKELKILTFTMSHNVRYVKFEVREVARGVFATA